MAELEKPPSSPSSYRTPIRERPSFPSMEERRSLGKRAAAEDGGDPEAWRSFDQSFRQVQSVLDRNRSLIQQVNENHQSRIPDNMAKNVALIQELNGNISKVVDLYSDLNSNFSTFFHTHHHHRSPSDHNGKPHRSDSNSLP